MEAAGLPAAPSAGRSERLLGAGLALGAALVLAAALTGVQPLPVALGVTLAILFAAAHRRLLAWRTLVALIILTILFIPIRRYHLPAHLPLELEPYRLLVVAVGAAFAASLLITPGMRVRRTGLEGPLAAIVAAMALSVFVRGDVIMSQGLASGVVRSSMFFASYILVFYLVTFAISGRRDIDALIKLLVAAAAFVGASAVVESRTGLNIFDHLQTYVPVLRFDGVPYTVDRGGARAYASGQHPIAMGAALMMLTPLAIYLVKRTGDRRWWLAFALLLMGALATKSRTAVIMLVVILVAMLVLRRRETLRALPVLLPLLVVVHVAMPGTIGTFKDAFFPQSGLINGEVNAGAMWHSNYGKGRIGEWGPALEEWRRTPLFGQGFGTRISDLADPHYNSPILDDQWLWSLLELGVVGVVALLWFFVALIRRLARHARGDESADGWLLATLAAAITAYPVGMLTFDSFAFIQCSLLMFILAAFGVAAIRDLPPVPARSRARERAAAARAVPA